MLSSVKRKSFDPEEWLSKLKDSNFYERRLLVANVQSTKKTFFRDTEHPLRFENNNRIYKMVSSYTKTVLGLN